MSQSRKVKLPIVREHRKSVGQSKSRKRRKAKTMPRRKPTPRATVYAPYLEIKLIKGFPYVYLRSVAIDAKGRHRRGSKYIGKPDSEKATAAAKKYNYRYL